MAEAKEKKKEAALYFARMTVNGLRMARNALEGYAHESGTVKREECPIVQVWEEVHANIASFLDGGEIRRFLCPFCGEVFEDDVY